LAESEKSSLRAKAKQSRSCKDRLDCFVGCASSQ
jgi:hypothetical protein